MSVMKYKIKFIDLFAGIGGFHFALHNLGAECVFASEWDIHASKTYKLNFYDSNPQLFHSGNFRGDITKVETSDIPDFDILTGGFPCQPFSHAGKSFQVNPGLFDVLHAKFSIENIYFLTLPFLMFVEFVPLSGAIFKL